MKKLCLLLITLFVVAAPGIGMSQSHFSVDTFEDFTLHTYLSNDPLGDVSFIIESEKKLVILEPQGFKPNIDELRGYVKNLGKPVEKILVSFHPAGLKTYKEGETVITKPMEAFLHSDASKGMLAHFKEAFKGQMDVEIIQFDAVISSDSTLEIDAVSYTLFPTSLPGMPGVNIDIDGKVLYQHFAPAENSHPSPFHINSIHAIDGALTDAQKAKENGYVLFVGSHFPGKGKVNDLEFHITYLQTMKIAANEAANGEEFIAKMKKSYPGLDGEKNLEAITGKIFN
ncbi:hypothetical protein [Desulfosediminicola flagellatus]|uniref:hypothetical protein n=1 Tax=Desulfosediminicola flagellatus TaxID=2569541 RepID=UPI0010AD4251|nr:hypothetical protein [Desulfosediminicola flagellatus]